MAVVKKRIPLKKKKLKRVGAEEEVVIKIGKPPEEEPKKKVPEEVEQESEKEMDLEEELEKELGEKDEEDLEEEPEDLEEDLVVISLGKAPPKEVEVKEEKGEEEGEMEVEEEAEVVVEGEPVEVEVEEEEESPKEEEGKKRRKLAALVIVIIVVLSSIGIYVLLQNKNPVAKLNLSHETAFEGDLIYMDGSNSSDDKKIVEYIWQFKPGTVYSETPDSAPDGEFDGKTSYTYEEKGDYTVKLTVRDEEDKEGTASSQIEITELVVTIPPEKIGDEGTFNVTGFVEVENSDGLFTINEEQGEFTLNKVHIDYEGYMISRTESITTQEDGMKKSHKTLKKYNEENLDLSGTVSGTVTYLTVKSPFNYPINDGSLEVKDRSYIDLTSKKVIFSDIESDFSLTVTSDITVFSNDHLYSYSNLREKSAVLKVEDLSEDRTFKMGDGHTDKVGDISYTWEVESVANIQGYPSLGIQIDIDRTTKDNNNIQEFDMWLWIANNVPFPIKTHIYTKIFQDGTTTIIEYNNEIQKGEFTRGTGDIPYGSCPANTPHGHYYLRNPDFEFVDWAADDDIPDMGGNASSLDSFLPQTAISFAKTNSGGLQDYLNTHTEAYVVNGYYNDTNDDPPTWNLTFGEEGDDTGYYVVIEDTGGGSLNIKDENEVSITEVRNSTSDFDKVLSFSASEQVFESDPDIYDECFDVIGNVKFYEDKRYGARANIIYPSISLTISLTIERTEYGYYLEDQDGSFFSAVDGINGQLIYKWEHEGDDVLSLIMG
ncbi:MAG: PKD domain-containing protein [Thermoplasmata archaeon]|nr:MAG: PKD domain-containing protein [Thermoplasmata archaeon]